MNKNLLKRIASVATELDQSGFTREAKNMDLILLKLAQEEMEGFEMDDSGDDEYAKAYFQKYPDAPRTYEEGYKRQKDNFNTPTVNTPPANTKQTDDFQSDESARQLAIKMLADKIPGLENYPRALQDMMLQGYAEKTQEEK